MKKIAKRAAALLCVVILMLSMMAIPVSAESDLLPNEVKMSTEYLNKEKCWTEAGKYVGIEVNGVKYSYRPRIAAELYAHAIADNLAYRMQTDKLQGNSWFTAHYEVESFEPLFNTLAQELVEHAHTANIGGEEQEGQIWLIEGFYRTWQHPLVNALNTTNTYWYIHSKLNDKKVVDVNGNKNKNGTKIRLYSKSTSKVKNLYGVQQFAFYPTGEVDEEGRDWYTIFKKNTFMTLDVAGGVAADGTKVQLYGYNGTAAQEWRLLDVGDGYCYIQNRLGYYLDAAGGSSKNGTQIQTYSFNGSDAQKWRLVESPW